MLKSAVKALISLPTTNGHASTLARVRGETLLAWFGGTREGAGDVDIYMARKTAEGWGMPFAVAREANLPHWNPVLYAQGDSVYLFYKVGHPIPAWHTRWMRSVDGGMTFSGPAELVEGDLGGRGPVRNKPLRLRSGRVLAPASVETDTRWDAFVDISDDDMVSFHKSGLVPLWREGEGMPGCGSKPGGSHMPNCGDAPGDKPDGSRMPDCGDTPGDGKPEGSHMPDCGDTPGGGRPGGSHMPDCGDTPGGGRPEGSPPPPCLIKGKGVIQPTLWQSESGAVHMLLRSTEGRILRSDSLDDGETWCTAYATALPNNNSGIDLVKMQGGLIALALNPVGKDWGERTPLSLDVSRDDGDSFHPLLQLEINPGEYSYPAVISEGRRLFVSYTWNRVKMAYWEIELEGL